MKEWLQEIMRNPNVQAILSLPNDVLISILTAAGFIIVGIFYISNYYKTSRHSNKCTSYSYHTLYDRLFTPRESLEMRHLLHMLLHDRMAAERLIAYEAERNPYASREENIRSAIERIQMDNR